MEKGEFIMEKKRDITILFSRLFEDIDEEKIRLRVENLKDEFPTKSNEELCQKIIDTESMLCGIIGAVTGALPWPWSILGIAPDLISLIYKQSNMVLSIAYVFGFDPNAKERASEVMGCIGVSIGAVAGTYGIKKLVERRMEERLIKELFSIILEYFSLRMGRRFVPILGAIGGAFLNYGSVQAVGNIALKYYSTKEKMNIEEKDDEKGLEIIEDVRKIEEEREKEEKPVEIREKPLTSGEEIEKPELKISEAEKREEQQEQEPVEKPEEKVTEMYEENTNKKQGEFQNTEAMYESKETTNIKRASEDTEEPKGENEKNGTGENPGRKIRKNKKNQ